MSSRQGPPDLKQTPGGWFYHPFEITLCGYTGSGKTMTAEAVVPLLRGRGLSIGYVKHDAHFFAMDTPGKDTCRMAEAGAAGVFIQDESHSALVTNHGPLGPPQPVLEQGMSAFDCLIVEGRKHSPIPKLLFLDPRGEIDVGPAAGEYDAVKAIVHREADTARARRLAAKLPGVSLVPEEPHAVAEFLLSYWHRRVPAIRTLVVTGGEITPTWEDEVAIEYRSGVSRLRHTAEIARSACGEVTIGVQRGQRLPADVAGVPVLEDRFDALGPAGAILTALHEQPRSAWLVLGCDLPSLEIEDVERLLQLRNPFRVATCFAEPADTQPHRDGSEMLPEPLYAVYEPKARGRLLAYAAAGTASPRGILRTGGVDIHPPRATE